MSDRNAFPAPGESRLFDEGLARRKAVLGEAYVQQAIEGADDFNRPLQQLTTEWCWGETWGNEALPLNIRSMLNIAMLTALNRPHELKLHVRGALNNGVTVEQIQAVLLQAAIYCGLPAAIDATRTAREVLKEAGAI
ncbi:carboxymuconolactone decarboxylase family protein [Ramlibacter sp. AW1]|uniref:Carboxymuconolactone decarboxylase family protein n=1 Tax=Ramlibacter aurantiacus TaxID=2801330 RepID=A0A936ZKA3_9BURK|nr:carboxymuconolactone decarboxylase family protein [Ramlibacter aurantiacus]MBL0422904.1 carboxymuconolactone decarboxylase family protein [Ramlibacter aurantiacus]